MPSVLVLWLVALVAVAAGWLLGWVWHRRKPADQTQWPAQWNVNGRPVLTADERSLYQELRQALPQHVILAKLSLLRFCQASKEEEARTWYKRLQSLHVTFAICTPSGIVVSVIDMETPQKGSASQRAQRMKEAVLKACRVRYVRCLPGHWPHQGLMAPWALGQTNAQAGASMQGNPLIDVGVQLAQKLRQRRAERAALWRESGFSQDSFFAFDSRFDYPPNSGPMPLKASGESN